MSTEVTVKALKVEILALSVARPISLFKPKIKWNFYELKEFRN